MLNALGKRNPLLVLLITAGAIAFVVFGSYYFGNEIGQGNENSIREIGIGLFALISVVVILRQPAVGLALVVAGLLVQNELQGVEILTSVFTTLGLLTAAAYVITRKDRRFFTRATNLPLMLMGAFFVWQLVSNPSASLNGTRNWTWTYLQLGLLALLAAELFDLKTLRWLMWVFMLACIPSAIQAFSGAQITNDFSADLVRSAGFQGNQNTLAFYLVVATVFTMTLQFDSKKRVNNLIYFALYAIYTLGIIGTVSRSGFVLLGVAFLLTPMIRRWVTTTNADLDEQKRRRRQRTQTILIAVAVAGGLATYIIPEEYWGYLNNTLFNTNEEDSGTQRRIDLAELAIETWVRNPIAGVGIGNFTDVSSAELDKEYSAHNLYLSILAETGIVGFALFMGWIVAAIREFYRMARQRDGQRSYMAAMWLTVMLMILLRAPTASTLHYDKLVWMIGGISVALSLKYAPAPIPTAPVLSNLLARRASRITPDAQIIEAPPLPANPSAAP